ncbi:DUF4870 domain-containing protein [Longispora albida]|uniref:DUF4870 domain-containing protein n=1 Tax=Longispora albida TaxID=203523 RepID=UPI00037BF55B|nr:DUF4870 domain-containing protein [Longispora albida]
MADYDPDRPVTGPPWTPPGPPPPPRGSFRPPARPATGYGYGGPGDPSDPVYAGPGPSRAEASDAALTHFLGAIGIIGPLLMYLLKGQRSPWVKANAAEALNFHLCMIGYTFAWFFVAGVLSCGLAAVTEGRGFIVFFLLAFVPVIASVTASVIAGLAANRGEFFRYPGTYRMVK